MKLLKSKLWIFSILVMMVLYAPVSIGVSKQEKPEQGIELNFITRHATDVLKPFRDAFYASPLAAEHNVAKIIFSATPAGQWVSKAETGLYDGAWGGGPSTFDQLAQLDLLPEITDTDVLNEAAGINETIAGVPLKRYNLTCTNDCSGNPVWIAAAISSFGFGLNYDKLSAEGISAEDAPKSWSDLADPKYYRAGDPLISIGNAPDTTSNTKIYQIMLQAFGWEAGWALISAIAGNSEIAFGSTEVLTAVQLGEVGIGIMIDFYGYSMQLQNPQTKYVIPQGQSIVNGDPISLLPGDPAKRAAANAFIEFVLSPEGQDLWFQQTINRLPARDSSYSTTAGLARPDLIAAYENAKKNEGIDFDDPRALDTENFLLRYFQNSITDVHTDLRANWAKIVNSYKAGDFNKTQLSDWIYSFGYPLVDETEATAIDQSISTSMEGQWRADMSTQYGAIGALIDSSSPANRTSPVDYFYVPPKPTSSTGTSTSMSSSSSVSGVILTSSSSDSSTAPGEVSPGFGFVALVVLLPSIALIQRRRRK